MKILCTSLWQNSWIPYWTKYIESRGHEVKWVIGSKVYEEKVKEDLEWCDAVLSMWAVGWCSLISKISKKPQFIIHRSFETFEDTTANCKVADTNWDNINQLFMLNESHFKLFNKKVKCVNPVFIKNGIDLDYWKFQPKKGNKIGWIANINHKKGEQLAFQAFSYLHKRNPLIQIEHLGNINSTRIYHYIQNIAPYLGTEFISYGWVTEHDYVVNFLKDKKYILCSSLVEGHPMNIIEAMATGCKPLIHRYPGVEHQFPEKWIWNDFDDLQRLYNEPYRPEEYRKYILDNYNYIHTYEPVMKAIEDSYEGN